MERASVANKQKELDWGGIVHLYLVVVHAPIINHMNVLIKPKLIKHYHVKD